LVLAEDGADGSDHAGLVEIFEDEELAVGRDFDLVASNPPYFDVWSGLVSPTDERALARHDATCSTEDLARAAKRLLKSSGAVCVVYPSSSLPGLMAS
jgi:tRNA1(Val) A37 N6-methylase TrmN6